MKRIYIPALIFGITPFLAQSAFANAEDDAIPLGDLQNGASLVMESRVDVPEFSGDPNAFYAKDISQSDLFSEFKCQPYSNRQVGTTGLATGANFGKAGIMKGMSFTSSGIKDEVDERTGRGKIEISFLLDAGHISDLSGMTCHYKTLPHHHITVGELNKVLKGRMKVKDAYSSRMVFVYWAKRFGDYDIAAYYGGMSDEAFLREKGGAHYREADARIFAQYQAAFGQGMASSKAPAPIASNAPVKPNAPESNAPKGPFNGNVPVNVVRKPPTNVVVNAPVVDAPVETNYAGAGLADLPSEPLPSAPLPNTNVPTNQTSQPPCLDNAGVTGNVSTREGNENNYGGP